MFTHWMWAVVGIGVVRALALACLWVWVLVLACGYGRGGFVSLYGGVGVPRYLSVERQGVSNERAVGSHGAVCMTV
jgi:hypothetical protein